MKIIRPFLRQTRLGQTRLGPALLGLTLLGLTLLGLTLAAAPALAQEAIRTGDGGAPPVAPAAGAAATQTESDEAWAHRVLDAAQADAKAAKPEAKAPCAAPADSKPHGQVWAGAGSRGYRDVGGVVTQPLGACGSVTLMLDHAQGDAYRASRAR
jgi:hypothetical protein